MDRPSKIWILLPLTLLFNGCSNFSTLLQTTLSMNVSPSGSPSPSPSSGQKLFISTAIPITSSSSSGGTQSTVFTLNFNSILSASKISAHCNAVDPTTTSGTALIAKPCSCQFSWTAVNPSNPTATPIQRMVLTTPALISDYQASCPAPSGYATEIPTGSQINISMIPHSTNPDRALFTVNPYNYLKGASATGSNFQDSTGNFFSNILRYACYQTISKYMTVQSRAEPQTQSTTSDKGDFLYATKFCVAKSSGGTLPANCPAAAPESSSQSDYFNLYIRASEAGGIQQFNSSFICPMVKEPISGSLASGAQGTYWPLDATFALSLGPSANFTVGVVAQTKLADGVATSSTCFPNASASGTAAGTNAGGNGPPADSSTMVSTCLGFASLPKTDGTCAPIHNTANQIVPTFRLRRFVALYPRLFDSTGNPLSGMNQGLDTVYVLDRPVKNSAATMAGPKPCPFSYFDRMSVTQQGGLPSGNAQSTNINSGNFAIGYNATNNPVWSGTNVDGTEFPNLDGTDHLGAPSCSAALPFLFSNNGVATFTFQTINLNNTAPGSRNHQYIRPVQAFTPYYVEDTNFLACAPQASPLQDPPLHFAIDPLTQQQAWCAEVYPTQNNNLASLDPPFPYPSTTPTPKGLISPFTSHTIKNVHNGGSCHATSITVPNLYPPAGSAKAPGRHSTLTTWDSTFNASQTCDRTVLNTSTSSQLYGISANPRMPLLARAWEVEAALTDPNLNRATSTQPFQCKLTYDPTGLKTYPSGGCCATGVLAMPATPTTIGNWNGAHLEPTVPCGSPNY